MSWRVFRLPAPRFVAVLLGAFVLTVSMSRTAMADAPKRVALVIGNSAYQHVAPQRTPASNAAAMGDMLKEIGFEVTQGQNLTKAEIESAIAKFSVDASHADLSILFYSGAGLEVYGTNYLVPIDSKLENDGDLIDQAIPLNSILQNLQQTKGILLVILDASRNNPFRYGAAARPRSPILKGIADIVMKSDEFVFFATRAGSTTVDGSEAISPFTAALVRQLPVAGRDLMLSLREVRHDVLKATQNDQEPFVYGSPGLEDILLVPAPTAAPDADSAARGDKRKE